MNRSERILRLPSLEISLQTAERILEVLHEIAQDHTDHEAGQRLRQAYQQSSNAIVQEDPEATTADLFVQRHIRDPKYLAVMNLPSYERYVFISQAESVEFQDVQFALRDLPSDINSIYIKVDGGNHLVEIKLNSNFNDLLQVANKQLNQVVVQGTDATWVSGIYQKIDQLFRPEIKQIRTFVYGNVRLFSWAVAVLAWMAEYSLARLLHPQFNISSPLSGTGAILLFAVLLGTILLIGNLALPIYSFWFPHFELEGNISRSRSATRNFIAGVMVALLTGGIVNTLNLLFSGFIHRGTGH
jgi:hypothetical protein